MYFGASKITNFYYSPVILTANFNDLAFVLGMTVFDHVCPKILNHSAGDEATAVGVEPATAILLTLTDDLLSASHMSVWTPRTTNLEHVNRHARLRTAPNILDSALTSRSVEAAVF